MSFRRRLTLFFVLIVVVPMVAVAALLVQVTRESRTGKADARLGKGLETALTVYRDDLADARRRARAVGRDPALTAAIERGDQETVRRQGERLVRSGKVGSIVIRDPNGRQIARAGDPEPVAGASVLLEGKQRSLGSLLITARPPRAVLGEIRRVSGLDGALIRSGRVIGASFDRRELGESGTIPPTGDFELAGTRYRVRTVLLRDASGGGTRLALLGPTETGGLTDNEALVAAMLVLFFGIAFIFTLLLMRGLHGQVGTMLDAARRIGGGDFSHKVPVEGNDEMAGLAREFNKMSEQLGDQVKQLHEQREMLEDAMRRIGDAFASGLDRRALLEIAVETAVDACGAEWGHARVDEGEPLEAEAGERSSRLARVMERAESMALRGRGYELDRDDCHVLARPLEVTADGRRHTVGVVAIGRSGEPFTENQRQMFQYLAAQAVISIENIDLHELIARQAVTDELTGLSNNRRFRELMAKEVERAWRFDHELSLLMVDIDDFKQVNDAHGHQQGDEVLREVAAILRSESRDVDEPARYGGEEFAIALPQTPGDGAELVAERIRKAIEAAQVGRLNGTGRVSVTVSVGIATLPDQASDMDSLIAAADEALYSAKRSGKNRTDRAGAPARSAAT